MATTTWNLDGAHTDVIFATKHMMVTTVRGKFATVAGSLELDTDNPTASRGSFTVKAASLNTGVEQRDGHLRSADFFNVEQFEDITFTATSVSHKSGTDYLVTGDLTVRDVTKPFVFDVEYLGLYQAMGGARRAGFHATGKLNREEFGLTWNVALETGGWLVGKEIKLEIDLAVEEAAPVAVEAGAASAS
jgi:polyisoprenoid-binding protein YceI